MDINDLKNFDLFSGLLDDIHQAFKDIPTYQDDHDKVVVIRKHIDAQAEEIARLQAENKRLKVIIEEIADIASIADPFMNEDEIDKINGLLKEARNTETP